MLVEETTRNARRITMRLKREIRATPEGTELRSSANVCLNDAHHCLREGMPFAALARATKGLAYLGLEA